MSLNSVDIDAVCDLVSDLCGIYLDESKSYLIECRLRELVARSNCESYAELANKVARDKQLANQVVDAITTNETLFFRDNSPFDALQHKLLPELIDSNAETPFPKRIRIWSAACSTGQEAYSIGMTIAETIPDYQTWDIQILGTDISPAAVEQARLGVYGKLEISRGMKPSLLKKYFVEHRNQWKICDEIRSLCRFKEINLLKPFSDLGRFDVVFCRNVAIYFSEKDRSNLFQNICEVLAPNGWVIVGSSESLAFLGPQWQSKQHCNTNCYQPNQPVQLTS